MIPGLIDTGQDLKTAYLDSQAKMNSEVKRLTAEVDLLSMAFGMDSVWSLFEAERDKKQGVSKKEDNKSKPGDKPKGILKKDISDFDYAHVLHMVKDRLHEVKQNKCTNNRHFNLHYINSMETFPTYLYTRYCYCDQLTVYSTHQYKLN